MEIKELDNNSNFGMNYYHESMGYMTRNNEQIMEDLSRIKSITDKIKIYKHPYADIDISLNIAKLAKEAGLYTIFSENFDGNTLLPPLWNKPIPAILTEGEWDVYVTKVLEDFEIVKNIVDEFWVSNELDIHTDKSIQMSGALLVEKQKNLIMDVNARNSSEIPIGIQIGHWTVSYNLSLLDRYKDINPLAFTLYCGCSNINYETGVREDMNSFLNKIDRVVSARPDLILGEWGFWNYTYDLETKGRFLLELKNILSEKNINNYIFTYGLDKFHKCSSDEVFKYLGKQKHCCYDLEEVVKPCEVVINEQVIKV